MIVNKNYRNVILDSSFSLSKADPWIIKDLRDSCSEWIKWLEAGGWLRLVESEFSTLHVQGNIYTRIQVVFCATLTHWSQTPTWTESCSSTLSCLCVQGDRKSYHSSFQVHLEYKVAEKLKVCEKAQRSFLGHYFIYSHLWNGNSQAYWNIWISLLI